MKRIMTIIAALSIIGAYAVTYDVPEKNVVVMTPTTIESEIVANAAAITDITARFAAQKKLTKTDVTTLLYNQYLADIESGDKAKIAKWHGMAVLQTIDKENGVCYYTYEDGFISSNKFRSVTAAQAKLSAIERINLKNTAEQRRRETLLKQIAAQEKALADYDSGRPRAAIVSRIETLKARLNDGTVTNVVTTVGGVGK